MLKLRTLDPYTYFLVAGFFFVIALTMLFSCSSLSRAASPENLKEDIEEKKETLQQKKEKIRELSRREEKVYSQLSRIEKRMQKIKSQLQEQEDRYQKLKKKRSRLLKKYKETKSAQGKIRERLQKLLATLWPSYLKRVSSRTEGMNNWGRLDRKVKWLKAISRQTETDMERLRNISVRVTASMAKLEEVTSKVQKELKKTEKLKDKLLGKKLAYLQKMQEIRAKRQLNEKRVQNILGTIESLNYKLKALTERKFSQMKGFLPWPCNGELTKRFNPDADPPQRGISLEVSTEARVKSVFWGKVVHNDKLRGFGKVIIVYHGNDYYSLYAFLNSSQVSLGQKVEKGEPIGTCGYYPEIETEGLYFELRFHQKAINPMDWLSS